MSARDLFLRAVRDRLSEARFLRFRFVSVILHPVDHTDLIRDAGSLEYGNPYRRDTAPYGSVFDIAIRVDPTVRIGDATLIASNGDRWTFRWDSRWRCGGCGKEIENDEQHSAKNLVPYCLDCAKVRRPGMFLPRTKETDS